ncbi:MAG: hypothetical protein RL095_927 [Verrucomicrobiota bacterium]|jgi:undecaprenyl-diphosphatase
MSSTPCLSRKQNLALIFLLLAGAAVAIWLPERGGMRGVDALMLGLIEGLTEFLPVSSTGHLVAYSRLTGLDEVSSNSLNIVIQIGAIFAVFVVWRQRIGSVLYGVKKGEAGARRYLGNLILAFIPCVVVGLLFSKKIKEHLFNLNGIGWALIIGGILLLIIDVRRRQGGKELESMPWQHALIIGGCQCIAMCPGTSRSLVVLLAAFALGYSLAAAVEFSFMLGLITLSAACVKELKDAGLDLFHHFGWALPLCSLLIATTSAALTAAWLLEGLKRYGLRPFGFYRLALGGFLLWSAAQVNTEKTQSPAVKNSSR